MKGEKEIKTINALKPNELWKIDFKIVDVDGVGYYLLLIIDDHSRFILYAKLHEEVTSDIVISALNECFEIFMENQRRY